MQTHKCKIIYSHDISNPISQELTVSFNPQLVVIDVAEDESLVEDFTVTYSISTGDALVVGKPLGMVTIDEPIQNIVVRI